MTIQKVVISDSSPLRYLILIGQAELLPSIYTEVLIPETVAGELQQSATPEAVRRWIASRPSWLHIVHFSAPPDSMLDSGLDRGERDAILLALQEKADLVIMDDREGVEQARRLGLTVTGTLGILDRAAERGMIDLASVVESLRRTIFEPIRL